MLRLSLINYYGIFMVLLLDSLSCFNIIPFLEYRQQLRVNQTGSITANRRKRNIEPHINQQVKIYPCMTQLV